MADKEAKRVL
jgi:hypothetical protein